MQSTGIVRKVDALGRIVLPIETRRMLNIEISDPLEIFTTNDMIILRKYQPGCIFCGNAEDIIEHHEKRICKKCLEELQAKA